jgi:hypothetical protein
MRSILFALLFVLFAGAGMAQDKPVYTDVLVVGGTTGGIAAALQTAKMGVSTVVVEHTPWLGGMLSAAAVSCTDGNHELRSGIWESFRQALYKHYKSNNLFTGWVSETCFEPHVADSIFKAWVHAQPNMQVYYHWYFDKAIMEGNTIKGAVFENVRGQKLTVYAKRVIDATDLGDVYAAAGAAYDLGTEDSTQSGEKIAPGKSDVIQDLTWAAVLKDYGKGANKTILMPPNYDATKYYCSTADAPCNAKPYSLGTQKVLEYGRVKTTDGSLKYMLNWPAFGNDYYINVVEKKPIEREAYYNAAKNFTRGFIYFLQTELKQPQIDFATDEVNEGMAFMAYNREGRRLKGKVRLNIDHIATPFNYNVYRTGISVGDYPVDHHHARYNGKVPPIPFPAVPSFNIPMGALIPENTQGLVVCEKGISVSNIANGTTRLQPVVLLTGQAAGMLAAISFKQNIAVQNVSITAVQKALLQEKVYLMPYADVKHTDGAFEAVQWIGSWGIIKGIGKSVGWANKTYFKPDSLVTFAEMSAGLNALVPLRFSEKIKPNDPVTTGVLFEMIARFNAAVAKQSKAARAAKIAEGFLIADQTYTKAGLVAPAITKTLTRKEASFILFNLAKGLDYLEKDFTGATFFK